MARAIRRLLNRTVPTPLLIDLLSLKSAWLLRGRDSERSGEPPLRAGSDRPYDALFAGALAAFETPMEAFGGECRGRDWSPGRVYNGAFESGDLEFYHAMLRSLKPRRLVEVGSGISTWYAKRALGMNAVPCEVTAIDPMPGYPPPPGVRHLRRPVQEVDLGFLGGLEAGDVLFIDSSHGAVEARFHVSSLLPRLRPGVVIHHHDLVYPYAPRFPEEEVVLDFYRGHAGDFEVLTGLAWIRARHRESLERLVPSFRILPGRSPGSLWARRRT